MYYDRGDLPIKMEYLTGGEKIAWTVDIDKLDFSLYLPLFFDGLSETKHPYKTYARQGVQDLLSSGGDKIYPVIPQLIIPIKSWVYFKDFRYNLRKNKCFQLIFIYLNFNIKYRCIKYTKFGCNVCYIENFTTIGNVIGFNWSSIGSILSTTTSNV